jgi:hypothetical protein
VAQELARIAGWLADPHPTSTVKVDDAAMAFMRDSGTDRMPNGPVSAIRAGS